MVAFGLQFYCGSHFHGMYFPIQNTSRIELSSNNTHNALPQNQWVPDGNSKCCTNETCKAEFSLFIRRHHCRLCGFIFCKKCSSDKIVLSFPLGPMLAKVCSACYDYARSTSQMTSSTTAECHMKRSTPVECHMKRLTPDKLKMVRSPTVMKEMFSLIENEKSRSPKNIQHSRKNTIFCFQCAKKWVHITTFGLLDNSVCITEDPEKCSTCDSGISVLCEPYQRRQCIMKDPEIVNAIQDPEKCSTCDLGTSSVSLEPYKREQSFVIYSKIANTMKDSENKSLTCLGG